MITLICPVCGEEFESYTSWQRKFCSRKCFGKAQSSGIVKRKKAIPSKKPEPKIIQKQVSERRKKNLEKAVPVLKSAERIPAWETTVYIDKKIVGKFSSAGAVRSNLKRIKPRGNCERVDIHIRSLGEIAIE